MVGDEDDREREQQVQAAAAIFEAALQDLVGQRMTPNTLKPVVVKRLTARARILPQLLENERDE